MSEEMNLAHAKKTFAKLCSVLDDRNWNYEKDEEALRINCGAQGDDLPMDIVIKVDPSRMVIALLSKMPFKIQESARLDLAIAVSAVNYLLVDGSFDYDITNGSLFFRMTNSFLESEMGEDMFSYLLLSSCFIIDEYNDKFLMLAKGMMSVEQFISAINE